MQKEHARPVTNMQLNKQHLFCKPKQCIEMYNIMLGKLKKTITTKNLWLKCQPALLEQQRASVLISITRNEVNKYPEKWLSLISKQILFVTSVARVQHQTSYFVCWWEMANLDKVWTIQLTQVQGTNYLVICFLVTPVTRETEQNSRPRHLYTCTG